MIVAICDNEETQRLGYEKRILALCDEMTLNVELLSYSKGKQLLFELDSQKNYPDLILMESELSDISGVAAAKTLRERGYKGELIFISKNDRYWMDAFDLKACNYVLKGETIPDRFNVVFKSAVTTIIEKDTEYMLLSCNGQSVSIKLQNIQYFEVFNRILTVHYEDKSFEFYSTMGKIEQQLRNQKFIRIHKSYLISLNYVSASNRNEVTMLDGTRLPLGRTYAKTLKEAWREKHINIEQ